MCGLGLEAMKLEGALKNLSGVQDVTVSTYNARKGALHLHIEIPPAPETNDAPQRASPPPVLSDDPKKEGNNGVIGGGNIGPNKEGNNGIIRDGISVPTQAGNIGATGGGTALHLASDRNTPGVGVYPTRKTRLHLIIFYELELVGPRDLRNTLLVCYLTVLVFLHSCSLWAIPLHLRVGLVK